MHGSHDGPITGHHASALVEPPGADPRPDVVAGPGAVDDGATHVSVTGARWIDLGGGVAIAPLHLVGERAGTAFLRFAAGARSPAHRHPAGEDLYVVRGRIRVGRRELIAGDFLRTPPGGVHDAEAHEPTVLLVTAPEAVEYL